MSEQVYLDNEQKHPKQTMWIRCINVGLTTVSAIFSIIISIISLCTVNEVKETLSQNQ